jgi:CheY-like chemotaxis protein
LGLATSHSIIKKHGGHIGVESQPGLGTTFRLYLPASSQEIPGTPVCEDDAAIKGSGKVLVMDDQETLRKLLSLMLPQLGYEAVLTKDGDDAIRQYRKAKDSGTPFDAVILDLTVPGGSGGKETLKQLFEVDPEVKAIVSSGYSSDPIMSNFREFGFRGVVAKPYDIKELGEVLHKVITREDE